MKLFNKSIDQIRLMDLNRLIDNSIPESIRLDYKKEISFSTSSDKAELLADISSFSNSEGGVIIYGIQEKKDEENKNTGTPEKFTPIKNLNTDSLTLTIENLVKDGLEPSLTKIKIKFIDVEDGKIIIIGIPKNYGLPKMVIIRGKYRFYARRNSGKYLMDVYELSSRFINADKMNLQYDNIHKERVDKVSKGLFLSLIDTKRVFIFSCFPLDNTSIENLDLTDKALLNKITEILNPIYSNGFDKRHNLEGFMTYSKEHHEEYETTYIPSYTQLFRKTDKLNSSLPNFTLKTFDETIILIFTELQQKK